MADDPTFANFQREAPYLPAVPMGERVLVFDRDPAVLAVVCDYLTEKGCDVRRTGDQAEALILLESSPFAVALLDIDPPGEGGLERLSECKRVSPDTEVVSLTSDASVETAIRASRMGAYDYLRKPFHDLEEVWVTTRRALEKRNLYLRNRNLVVGLEHRNIRLARALRRMTSLIDAGRAMSGIQGIRALLDFFIGQVVTELDAERASIMQLDPARKELFVVASRGLPEEYVKKARVKLGDGVSGVVASTGKPILVKDVKEDPRAKYPDDGDMRESFISSPIVLSIPILIEHKVLGVINVTNKRSGGSFDDDDMAYIFALAGQAAVAIERTRHFDDLQKAYETLKEAQDHIVSVERLKALGQMAAGVAHDFNNILNALLGRVDLLIVKLDRNDADATEAVRSGLMLMEKIALQGAETVRRIQDITRIRKDHSDEALDINAVILSAIEMTRPKWKDEGRARGAEISVMTDLGDVPVTAGNPHEIGQVISNLVFNAVEAMPRGGTLSLRTFMAGDSIEMEVSDTGVGIPPEQIDKIFEPFFTTKETGQGLGMSVVYGILSRYGGSVQVASEPGDGATFRVRLPIKAVGVPMVHADGEGSTGYRARVLLVEDDEINREIFSEYVAAVGHEARTAVDGTEGVALFMRERFDLVITDLSMPGISGWEVARKVKDANSSVPVVLLSGWAIQADDAQVKASGVDFVVAKPCTLDTFRQTVNDALQMRLSASSQ